MKLTSLFFIASTIVSVFAQAIPEAPLKDDNILPVVDKNFTAPYFPSASTSYDGRIGMYLRKKGDYVVFVHMVPEKMNTHFNNSAPGIPFKGRELLKKVHAENFYNTSEKRNLVHSLVCDGTMGNFGHSAIKNPMNCKSNPKNDCYNLKVISSVVRTLNNGNKVTEVWTTPVNIEVEGPKTKYSKIKSISYGVPLLSRTFEVDNLIEMSMTRDGKLFVARTSISNFSWKLNNGEIRRGNYDVVYALSSEQANACDPSAWSGIKPISFMPYDINFVKNNGTKRYGLAQYKFRDSEGDYFSMDEDLRISYPWIDRSGSNLFSRQLGDGFITKMKKLDRSEKDTPANAYQR